MSLRFGIGAQELMKNSQTLRVCFEASRKVFGNVSKPAAVLSAIVMGILSFAGGCAYELPEQPTVFITRKTPDDLPTVLARRKEMKGKLAVLGGQIVRRKDTRVGRYFLVRAMELTDDSYPKPPQKMAIKVLVPSNSFIIFVPSLRMVGHTKPKTHKQQSSFVVFGEHEDQTLVIGPGHLVTAVGEVKGMIHFPSQPAGPRYLLLMSHYIMLWSKANPADYPLLPE